MSIADIMTAMGGANALPLTTPVNQQLGGKLVTPEISEDEVLGMLVNIIQQIPELQEYIPVDEQGPGQFVTPEDAQIGGVLASDVDKDFVYHASGKKLDEIKEGTFFGTLEEAKSFLPKDGDGYIYAVPKGEIEEISADEDDVFGDEWIKAGLAVRSGRRHKPTLAVKTNKFGYNVEKQFSEKLDGDSLYHESDPESALSLALSTGDSTGLNVSDDIDFALGQKGQGVIVEFDKQKLLGDRGSLGIIKKPGFEFVGQKEFQVNGGTASPEAVKSITVKPGARIDKATKRRMSVMFPVSKKLDDGTIKFTRK